MKTNLFFGMCLLFMAVSAYTKPVIMPDQMGCDWTIPESYESLNKVKNNHFWRFDKGVVKSILLRTKEFDFSRLDKKDLYLQPVVQLIGNYKLAYFYFYNPEITEASVPIYVVSGFDKHIVLKNFDENEAANFLSSCNLLDEIEVKMFLVVDQ